MKFSKQANQLLDEVKTVQASNVKLRLPVVAVKEVVMANAMHAGVAAAALSLLAKLADTTPMDFQHRAIVERLIELETTANPADFEACTKMVNEVLQILNSLDK